MGNRLGWCLYPAASFLYVAQAHGAYTVEINPDDTPATDTVDLVLRERAEVVFDQLEKLLTQGTSTPAP